MSAINGDKARFHKKRKAGIARRARNRERFGTDNVGKTASRPAAKKEASA
jgi:hypothetical protein